MTAADPTTADTTDDDPPDDDPPTDQPPTDPAAALRLRLVRHGEVAAAHKGTFYGGAEVPLSEHGHAASLELAGRLARGDAPPQLVVSSPLSRARVLAERLAALCAVPLQIDAAFLELDRGAWTHVSRDELERTEPGAVARYLEDPEHHNGPGGERESQLCARVWRAIDGLAAEHAGQRVVVVCHGHVIRSIMRRWLGWTARESVRRFVPYHAVVDAECWADGRGRITAAPELELPDALRER